MSGNVSCPIHGDHGALSFGRCWFCESSNPVPPTPPAPEVTPQVTSPVTS